MTRNNIVAMPIDKGNVKWNILYQVEMATRVVNVKNSIYSHLSRFEIKLSTASIAVQLGCRRYVSCSLHCPCFITSPVWLSCLEERKKKTGLMWRRHWEFTVSALIQGSSGNGFTSLGQQCPTVYAWLSGFLFISRIKTKIFLHFLSHQFYFS